MKHLSSVAKDIAIGAGGLGLDSQSDQISGDGLQHSLHVSA